MKANEYKYRRSTIELKEIASELEDIGTAIERTINRFLERYDVDAFELVSLLQIWRDRCNEMIEEMKSDMIKTKEQTEQETRERELESY